MFPKTWETKQLEATGSPADPFLQEPTTLVFGLGQENGRERPGCLLARCEWLPALAISCNSVLFLYDIRGACLYTWYKHLQAHFASMGCIPTECIVHKEADTSCVISAIQAILPVLASLGCELLWTCLGPWAFNVGRNCEERLVRQRWFYWRSCFCSRYATNSMYLVWHHLLPLSVAHIPPFLVSIRKLNQTSLLRGKLMVSPAGALLAWPGHWTNCWLLLLLRWSHGSLGRETQQQIPTQINPQKSKLLKTSKDYELMVNGRCWRQLKESIDLWTNDKHRLAQNLPWCFRSSHFW